MCSNIVKLSTGMLMIYFFIAGALGSLAKDIIQDNKIQLPKKTGGEFALGFLGGMIMGGISGYFVDNNLTQAFLAGYAGTSLITGLSPKKNAEVLAKTEQNIIQQIEKDETIEQMIRRIAMEENVDQELAVKVAKCESGLKPYAMNINKTGSRDRGIFQINDYYHKEVTDAQAFDPEFSTRFFCKAIKNGNLSWWNASKKCWDK